MLVLLDDAIVLSGDYQVRTVDLEINLTQGRLNIYLDDGCICNLGFTPRLRNINE